MTFICDIYSVYHYRNSNLTLCDSFGLVEFDMWDNSFKLSVKSTPIKIGDNAQVLEKLFPKSYAVRDNMGEEGTYKGMTCVRVYLPKEDQWLLCFFNRSGIIKSICVWQDNT